MMDDEEGAAIEKTWRNKKTPYCHSVDEEIVIDESAQYTWAKYRYPNHSTREETEMWLMANKSRLYVVSIHQQNMITV